MGKINEIGNRYGRLLVLDEGKVPSHKTKAHWLCKCDCGNTCTVMGEYLRNGDTRSCGCLLKESRQRGTHGMRKTKEYAVWANMKQRCDNPNNEYYEYYGGRGIQVCPEWSVSFERFYLDMGPLPTLGHKIDREDNDGNYEPGNCRWVTHATNCQNRRSTKLNDVAVKVIRHFYHERGYTQARIAMAYGVSQTHVSSIVRGTKWT